MLDLMLFSLIPLPRGMRVGPYHLLNGEGGRLTVDLKAFFEILLDILEPENGVFSFWNGLGATSRCFIL